MVSSNGTDKSQQPLVTERSVAALPWRTPESTWKMLVTLFTGTLRGRLFPRVSAVQQALQLLEPVAFHLLALHHLEEGSVEFDCGDLRIVVQCLYRATREEEDLLLPPGEILGPLPPLAIPVLRFRLSRPLTDPQLWRMLSEVHGGGVLLTSVITDTEEGGNDDGDN